MTFLDWGSFVLQGIPAVGLILAGNRNHYGWVVCLLGQGFAVTYGLLTDQLGFVAWAPVFIGIYTANWMRWRRRERVNESERVGGTGSCHQSEQGVLVGSCGSCQAADVDRQ